MISEATKIVALPDGSTARVARPEVIGDLYETGCAVPDAVRVSFNLGTKKVWKLKADGKTPEVDENGKKILADSYPILTTVVDWADGTKTVVQNSKNDGLKFDDDGEVNVFSKECGFVFALAKRIMSGKLFADARTGETVCKQTGFGITLSKMIDKSIDQNKISKMKAAEKAAAKQIPQAKKVKTPNPSLATCVKELNETIKILKADLEELKATNGKEA